MSDQKEDKPEDRYRDDPEEFAASADSVRRGSSIMTGGGVESSAEPMTSMSRGSQEDWRPDPEAAAKKAASEAANDDRHPSNGSDASDQTDAGFEGEGQAGDQDDAVDADEADGGTSKVAPNNPQSPDDRER